MRSKWNGLFQNEKSSYRYNCWSSQKAEEFNKVRFDARSGGILQNEGQALTAEVELLNCLGSAFESVIKLV